MSAPDEEAAILRREALRLGLERALARDPEDLAIAYRAAQANRALIAEELAPEVEPWRPPTVER